jgi:hypothetical protein
MGGNPRRDGGQPQWAHDAAYGTVG